VKGALPAVDLWIDVEDNSRLATEALEHGLCLAFNYHGHSRLVEVHTVGITAAGRRAMCSFQVDGGTNSGEIPGWRLFCFDECTGVRLSAAESRGPRPGYKRGAQPFRSIIAEL
jgi:hypothetical protein